MPSLDASTHTYYDDQGEPIRYSVTQYIARFFPPFRAQAIASCLARKRGVTTPEVLAEWRQTATHGSEVHEGIHHWLNGVEEDFQHEAFFAFVNDHPGWTLIKSEYVVHRGSIAGSIDALFVDEEGRYHLVDWKTTSKDLRRDYGRRALPPIDHLADTAFEKYSLQLHLYRHLLLPEHQVDHLWIVQLRDNGSFTKHAAADRRQEIEKILIV